MEIVYNDPAKSKQMPGVAAMINGQKITMRELAEECIDRHGNDVLEGTINRRLLDQALRKRNLKVTDADLEAEIARAAVTMGKTKEQGKPDVEGWLEHVTKSENITREVYVRDEVWPSVALKKLVGDKVQITKEDLQRGYEANYGPKVRCRAIVLNNQRRAQEVWEKARQNPTVKNFGDLAEQYSIEAGSRSLRGEVPPIQRHGGQPLLEKEAFSLSKQGQSAVGHRSGRRHVRDPVLRRPHQSRSTPASRKSRTCSIATSTKRSCGSRWPRRSTSCKENSHVDNFLASNVKVPKKEERAAMAVDAGIPTPKVINAIDRERANISALPAVLSSKVGEWRRAVGQGLASIAQARFAVAAGRFFSRAVRLS